MSTTQPTNTYPDQEYEDAHLMTFSTPKVPIPTILPPDTTKETFDRAITDFVEAVGKDKVFVGEGLSHYVDPYDLSENDEKRRKLPSAAVCPTNVDEVRAVLAVATKHSIPLWTFSRGKNLGYGGPAPRVNGSVALDLHKMNRIIEVNDQFSFAVVEPGVTWKDLIDYCNKNGKKVWSSSPSLSWGSVTGNTLDRGTGFGDHFSHFQSVSGIEVMLGDGDVVRTGQFGIEGSPSAFLSKFTYGPSLEGLFLQSNLGVVTKLSLWMTPQPQAFMECTLNVPNFEDVAPLVDSLGRMRQTGLIPSCVWVLSRNEIIATLGKRHEFWDGEGAIPEWRLAEIGKQFGLSYWVARWGIYGPKRTVQAQFEDIQEILNREVPTGTVKGTFFEGKNGELLKNSDIPNENGRLLTGVSSMFSLPFVDWALPADGSGKGAHGDYAPIIPNSGKLVLEWLEASYKRYQDAGFEPATDFFMHERHVLMVNMFAYDQRDAKQTANVEKMFLGFHEDSKQRGYGMYRAHVNFMDLIAQHNNFNNYAYLRFVEKIKDAVDPSGILAPGKSGIWPQKYRHLREPPAEE
ncbi:hypothetical protein SEUCBS139899_005555 [Sporothrix eucalyptigena]|uniref:FAD-binding PCMH-type domain-containing protein n=1 Tax=Sporothrix eucalyptigena TaxID=1812306 RepID=A0ABP0C1P3_9PEZI